ncbi:MAG: hypothetical protein MUO76_17825 [Anaerolineaceae bacterium]|nr:hypothetical protein [Anaerolineaceae bacterium]
MRLYKYAENAITILKHCIQLYQDGCMPFYRVAALQLRMLLCDTTRRHAKIINIALIPRLIPDLTLPPIGVDGEPDHKILPISLPEWLTQELPAETPMTIRELIRRVCDQDGGAHVDPKPVAGLSNLEAYETWIIRIGIIISDVLENHL